jgi:hypothetical protein
MSLALLALVYLACANADPEEGDRGSVTVPAELGPSPVSDNHDGGTNLCDHMQWCPTRKIWPSTETLGSYPGVSQICYCECDVNLPNPQPSCANSPMVSECGAIYDIVLVGGVPTKTPRFPQSMPFVCRYSEYQHAQ